MRRGRGVQLTVLSNCALVAPHFTATAMPCKGHPKTISGIKCTKKKKKIENKRKRVNSQNCYRQFEYCELKINKISVKHLNIHSILEEVTPLFSQGYDMQVNSLCPQNGTQDKRTYLFFFFFDKINLHLCISSSLLMNLVLIKNMKSSKEKDL